jgi:hypothetical protein
MKRKLWFVLAAAWAISPVLWGQSITVTAPAAGSEWCAGTTQVITWTSSGVAGPLSIKLRLAGAPDAPPVMDIVASTENVGAFSWPVPATLAAGRYLVRVRTVSDAPLVYDDSADFTVCAAAGPSLALSAPNGGQVWFLGETQPITWRFANLRSDIEWVKLSLYKNGREEAHFVGSISASYALGSGGSGSMPWNVGSLLGGGAAVVGNNCFYVKVSTLDNSLADFSDAPFTINLRVNLDPVEAQVFAPPAAGGPLIEVPTPLAPLTITHLFRINWRAEGVSGNVVVNLLKESGGTFTLATAVDPGRATGHFSWTVGQLANPTAAFPLVAGQRFRFQVAGGGANGLSRWFEIVRPELSVSEPHSGERLRRGDSKTIRWSGADIQGDVHIEAYFRHLPAGGLVKYQRLFANASNLGSRSWTIWPRPGAGHADLDPPPTGNSYRWHIRVISARNPAIFANSEEFRID